MNLERASVMIDNWYKLYGKPWTGIATRESNCHPAKFSYKLIDHIYSHAIAEGWIKRGSVVLDPFGGVALGAFPAIRRGINWIGVELEEKYFKIGQVNIEYWKKKFAIIGNALGTAVLIKGDSRKLLKLLELKEPMGSCHDMIVSSPPFEKSTADGGYQMLGKYAEQGRLTVEQVKGDKNKVYPSWNPDRNTEYAPSPENIGNFTSNPESLDVIVSSPPYGENLSSMNDTMTEGDRQHRINIGRDPDSPGSFNIHNYSQDEENLSNKKVDKESLDVIVSSPPYSGSPIATYDGSQGERFRETGQSPRARLEDGKLLSEQYGSTNGQLAVEPEEDFWFAARDIVLQARALLKPGGVAIFVVKAYVKNKKIVDFPEQWCMLCEACGFETIHIHRAWMVEERKVYNKKEQRVDTVTVEHLSFFRRMINKKYPDLRIDHEVVLCMRKI